MDLENKNSQILVQQNRGVFNPQFRKKPLQILQRERKYQHQVQAPFYIEETPSQSAEDDQREVEDQISAMYIKEYEEEEECEEEYIKAEVSFDQEEMDDYCRQFTDFMQADLHNKYDLRSRKRSRTQDDEEQQQELVSSPMETPQSKNSLKNKIRGNNL